MRECGSREGVEGRGGEERSELGIREGQENILESMISFEFKERERLKETRGKTRTETRVRSKRREKRCARESEKGKAKRDKR